MAIPTMDQEWGQAEADMDLTGKVSFLLHLFSRGQWSRMETLAFIRKMVKCFKREAILEIDYSKVLFICL
jgi:hypothetical protein